MKYLIRKLILFQHCNVLDSLVRVLECCSCLASTPLPHLAAIPDVETSHSVIANSHKYLPSSI